MQSNLPAPAVARISRGVVVKAYGRVGLRSAIEGKAAGRSLAGEQAATLVTRLTAFRKEFPGMQTEVGVYFRHDLRRTGTPVSWRWPYAAAWLPGDRPNSAKWGALIVPCATSCPRIMTIRLPMADGGKRKVIMPNMFCDLVPVFEDVTGSGSSVTLTAEQIAGHDAVRAGDTFVSLLHAPWVRSCGTKLGYAARFGGMEEMLDGLRCQLVFDLLPSA